MTNDQNQRQAILESLAACDTSTLLRLEALLKGARDNPADTGKGYLDYLHAVAESDITGLKKSEQSYGDSWKRRGGVDTFHMLARKWDRVEKRVATDIGAAGAAPGATPYDIFEHIAADRRADGIIDDVRDLRRYLMLVEAEIVARSASNLADSARGYLDHLQSIAQSDISNIEEKEQSYGSSWKRRAGIGAFMMFARKWDRIGQRVATRIDPAAGARPAQRGTTFSSISLPTAAPRASSTTSATCAATSCSSRLKWLRVARWR